jgi:hypothetical protein
MALTAQEQKELNAALEEYNDLYERLLKNGYLGHRQKERMHTVQERINDLSEKENQISNRTKKIQKDLASDLKKLGKTKRKEVGIEKNLFGLRSANIKSISEELQVLADSNDKNLINNNLAEDLRESLMEIGDGQLTLNGLKTQQAELQQLLIDGTIEEEGEVRDLTEEEKERIKRTMQLNQIEQKRMGLQEGLNKKLEAGDKLLGGYGSTIKQFLMNPLTAVVAILTVFGKQQEAIAKKFGAIGVTQMRDDLMKANIEFTKLTLEGEKAFDAISGLSNQFGIGLRESSAMADSVGELSLTTGESVDNATKLVGLFVRTQGLTAKQASNLLKSTQALAKANNVAPDLVLEDIAKNTEAFALFAKDGGENLLRAAVQARKLGLSLDTVTKTAEGLLDFQNSLNKEIEASILLGRNVDLTRARELAFLGETEELQKEILNIVGSQSEFNDMNMFQRKALAAALNMEASELQKIVGRQKEAVTLQGELARQDLSQMIPEETITAVAKLIAEFKTLGMQIAEDLGPPLMNLVKGFAGFVKALDESIGLANLFAVALAALTGKMVLSIVKTVVLAAAHIGLFTAKMASFTMGIGALAAVATGAMIFSSMQSMMSQGKQAGQGLQTGTELGGIKQDTVQALHKGETVLNAKDTAMLQTSLTAVRGGGTFDTQRMERQNDEMKQEMAQLRSDMAGYFGIGGSANKAIATGVGETILTA